MRKAKRQRSDRRTLLGVGRAAGAFLIVILSVSACAAATTTTPTTSMPPGCDIPFQMSAVADSSIWADSPYRYGAIENYSADPSQYATMWTLKLQHQNFGQAPPIQNQDKLQTFLEKAIYSPDPDLGSQAAALNLISTALSWFPPAAPARSFLKAALQNVKLAGLDPDLRLLDKARLVLASADLGQATTPEQIYALRSGISSVGMGKSPSQILAITAALKAINPIDPNYVASKSSIETLNNWANTLLEGNAVSIENLPAFDSLENLAKTRQIPLAHKPERLSANVIPFKNGWYGVQGTVAPDPQVTYYVHELGLDKSRLNLEASALAAGWLAPATPSLETSALWANIGSTCNFPSTITAVTIDTQELQQKKNYTVLALLAQAGSIDFDKPKAIADTTTILKQALKSGDAINVARVISMELRLNLPITPISPNSLKPKTTTLHDIFGLWFLKNTGVIAASLDIPKYIGHFKKANGTYFDSRANTTSTTTLTIMGRFMVENPNNSILAPTETCGTEASQTCTTNILDIAAAVAWNHRNFKLLVF